jgi:hypothetical protein
MDAKEREGDDMVTSGTVPVPVRRSVWGDPEALSVIFSIAERTPAAPGVNVRDMVQFAAMASEAGQVFVRAKSDRLAPLMEMPLRVRLAVPEFVRVIS